MFDCYWFTQVVWDEGLVYVLLFLAMLVPVVIPLIQFGLVHK